MRPLLLDGAMGTELMARGLPPGASPDLWSLERPNDVREVHAAYVEAGAEVITTNSFGANPVRLRAVGALDLIEGVNREAVRLAREAASGRAVAGDVGPTGEMLAPLGKLSEEEARHAFRTQARLLAQEGVDLFIVETFFSAREALCALEAIRETCSIPVWVSLTFRRTPRGFFTVYGDRAVPSLTRLLEAGAAMVGANCTLPPQEMGCLAREVVPVLGAHTFFQPNAGDPVPGETVVHPVSPDDFARSVREIVALGAGAVGGCCGTTPAHIRAAARLVEEP